MKKFLSIIFILVICIFQISNAGILIGSGATGGGSPAFSACDDFNRGDSDTLGNLSCGTYTWTEQVGDLDIESNQCHFGTVGEAIATVGATRSTGYVEADVNCEGNNYSIVGVTFWYTDSNNYWYAAIYPASGDNNDVVLFQVSGGTPTEVDDASFFASNNTTYTLTVTYNATTVTVDINSSEYISYGGSFGGNSGDVGIRIQRGGGVTGYADDFDAGD